MTSTGVALAASSGDALRQIVGEVAQISGLVDEIAEAAAALVGSKIDDAALDRLAAAASAAARPIDDKRGTKEFRIKVAGVLARRAAKIALDRAMGKN